MGIKYEVEAALHAHSLWRTQFRDFLNGKAPFDLATVSATDQCVFGKWLANEGHRMMPPDFYDAICAAHHDFHHVAGGIIQKIKEKRYAEAHADIAQDGALDQMSLRLKDLLLKLALHESAGAVVPLPQKEPEAAAATPLPAEGAPPQNAPD